MTAPHIKPSAAIDILISKVLPRIRDPWERDAVALAIEALEKTNDSSSDNT